MGSNHSPSDEGVSLDNDIVLLSDHDRRDQMSQRSFRCGTSWKKLRDAEVKDRVVAQIEVDDASRAFVPNAECNVSLISKVSESQHIGQSRWPDLDVPCCY